MIVKVRALDAAPPGVFDRDRSGARRGDVTRRDSRGELGPVDEGGGATRSIPAHPGAHELLPFTVSVKAGRPRPRWAARGGRQRGR